MNSRNVARGNSSSTRTPVNSGTAKSSSRQLDWSPPCASDLQRHNLLTRRGVRLADRFILGTMLRNEFRFAVLTQQACRHRHGAAGVEDVDDRLAVMRRDFDRRVRAARGRAADEQRQLETCRSISRAT